jgi:hypothetical protein
LLRAHVDGALSAAIIAGLIAAACITITFAVSADTGTIVEEATGTRFDQPTQYEGKTYRCLGVGVRKHAVLKIYALAFCVDTARAGTLVREYAKTHHAGLEGEPLFDALRNDAQFFDTLARNGHSRLVTLKMQRKVSRDQLASTIRRSLTPLLTKAKLDELDAAITQGAKKGQVVTISAVGPKLTVDVAGKARTVEDEEVARNLFLVWLGPDSVSPSLRENIARRAAFPP